MRAALAVLLALGLAACDPLLESNQPLFSASGGAPKPGLWAVLEEPCAAPTTPAIKDWPECAMPVWLTSESVTVVMMSPVRSSFLMAAGRPAVLQISSPPDPGDPRRRREGFAYVAAEPEGPAPYTRGRVWLRSCELEDEAECTAASPDEVRKKLAAVVAATPPARALWIAP